MEIHDRLHSLDELMPPAVYKSMGLRNELVYRAGLERRTYYYLDPNTWQFRSESGGDMPSPGDVRLTVHTIRDNITSLGGVLFRSDVELEIDHPDMPAEVLRDLAEFFGEMYPKKMEYRPRSDPRAARMIELHERALSRGGGAFRVRF